MGGTDMSEDAIECTVKSLQWIYAVVLALSIGEAFKEFMSNADHRNGKYVIQWDRLPPLLSLLLLVLPFYHGMARWLYDMYCTDQVHGAYGHWLLVDCVTFTVEAGLFFVLARSLDRSLWWRFNCTVAVLLAVDIVWGAFMWGCRSSSIDSWVIVNVCTVAILMAALFVFRKRKGETSLSILSLFLVVILVRTILDYWTGWDYYFPK